MKASRHWKGIALGGMIPSFLFYNLILKEWQLQVLFGTNCLSLIKLSLLQPWQSISGQVFIYICIQQPWQKTHQHSVVKFVPERSEYLATVSLFQIITSSERWVPNCWILDWACGRLHALFLTDFLIFCARRKKINCYENNKRRYRVWAGTEWGSWSSLMSMSFCSCL